MTKQLRYSVNIEIKNEYDDLIKEKYENKYSNCGKTVENLMKLYLTLNGESKYQDDPDVQELLEAARKTPCTHTSS